MTEPPPELQLGVAPPPNGLAKLAAKLVAVMHAVNHIPKRGHNDFHNYDYALETDVADAVRTAMAEQRLAMIPSLVEIREREIQTRQGKAECVTTVILEYTFIDADSGACWQFRMPGSGQDVGDKGLMKAITASQKYAELKAFHLSTGDDPEADDEEIVREPGSDDGGEESWPDDAAAGFPPDVEPSPTAPAKDDCISPGKVKRIYALLNEAAKRVHVSAPEMKEKALEKIRDQLHVEKIEHIPWKGQGYQRLCDWIEAQGRK